MLLLISSSLPLRKHENHFKALYSYTSRSYFDQGQQMSLGQLKTIQMVYDYVQVTDRCSDHVEITDESESKKKMSPYYLGVV